MSGSSVIGVTGLIGAGKTTVSRLLMDRLAADNRRPLLIDADRIVHELFEREDGIRPLPPDGLLDRLAKIFGSDIVTAEGRLDRALLAARGFATSDSARSLNAAIHPAVIAEAKSRIENHDGTVLLDVPLLFESGMDELCDFVVVVTAPRKLREARSRFEDMAVRERLQWSEDAKRARADLVIENEGTLAELESRVAEVMRDLE